MVLVKKILKLIVSDYPEHPFPFLSLKTVLIYGSHCENKSHSMFLSKVHIAQIKNTHTKLTGTSTEIKS